MTDRGYEISAHASVFLICTSVNWHTMVIFDWCEPQKQLINSQHCTWIILFGWERNEHMWHVLFFSVGMSTPSCTPQARREKRAHANKNPLRISLHSEKMWRSRPPATKSWKIPFTRKVLISCSFNDHNLSPFFWGEDWIGLKQSQKNENMEEKSSLKVVIGLSSKREF